MANTEEVTALRQDVRELTDELKKVNDRMDASERDRRGLHRRNRLLAGAVVFLMAVTGGSIFAAVTAVSASNDAKANADRIASVAHAGYQSCLANNVTRQDTRNLWAAIISTLQPQTTSPQGRKFIADLQHDVDVTTTPRVCVPA